MFLVKKPGSKLTVEEFTHWVEDSMVSNNMPFYGGFSFLDNLPLSSVCSGILISYIFVLSDKWGSLEI